MKEIMGHKRTLEKLKDLAIGFGDAFCWYDIRDGWFIPAIYYVRAKEMSNLIIDEIKKVIDKHPNIVVNTLDDYDSRNRTSEEVNNILIDSIRQREYYTIKITMRFHFYHASKYYKDDIFMKIYLDNNSLEDIMDMAMEEINDMAEIDEIFEDSALSDIIPENVLKNIIQIMCDKCEEDAKIYPPLLVSVYEASGANLKFTPEDATRAATIFNEIINEIRLLFGHEVVDYMREEHLQYIAEICAFIVANTHIYLSDTYFRPMLKSVFAGLDESAAIICQASEALGIFIRRVCGGYTDDAKAFDKMNTFIVEKFTNINPYMQYLE